MDRFGPTGKVSKKRVHLLRWTTFPGRTGWNFGRMDRAPCFVPRPRLIGIQNGVIYFLKTKSSSGEFDLKALSSCGAY